MEAEKAWGGEGRLTQQLQGGGEVMNHLSAASHVEWGTSRWSRETVLMKTDD